MKVSDQLYEDILKQYKITTKFEKQTTIKIVNQILGYDVIISKKKGTHYKYVISPITEELYKIYTEIQKRKEEYNTAIYEIIED